MNARTKALMIGGIVGALAGVLAAWLYANSNVLGLDAEGNEQIATPSAGEALKLSLGLLGVMRMLSGSSN